MVREDFNVSVIKEYQAGLVQTADLLVVEKGQAGIVKGQDLREDAGHRCRLPLGKGKTLGNVDKDSCSDLNGYLLPVPGGLGPMLIAKLMENLSQAAFKNRSSS